MTKSQLAYAAGLVDGEGYIGVYKVQPTTKNQLKFPYYRLGVSIRMADPQAIKLIAKLWNFPFRKLPARAQRPNWRPLYRLDLANKKARNFLILLLPFLLVKQKHAKLALQFSLGPTVGRQGRAQTTINKCERLYKKLRKLNHRGKFH